MGQSLYFNVVSDNSVDEMVEVFMYSVTNEDPLAPPATPVASPTALTEAYKKHPQYGRRIT
jgi:hypothetical protein